MQLPVRKAHPRVVAEQARDAEIEALLTMLGAAGEAIGIDKHLKTNTVKRRTRSLLN